MCGIAGIVALDGAPAPLHLVERMMSVIEHRGPDDSGQWAEGPCALGHRRLTIIDLSANGRQPISNEDESVWLTYNGEVYNFASLRTELEGRGHRFRSRTDSEVVVHLYEDDGPALVRRLDGMFAFGLWDTRRRRLLLARDRLGIKPLYYALAGRLLLFASEIKAILATGLVPARPNLDAVASYLAYRAPVGPMTMFEGIRSLPAGHTLVLQDGRMQVEQYWDLEVPRDREDRGEPYYREGVRTLLRDAVRKRLISDVPLGAYLSGGLDSSIVVALMAQEWGAGIKTYAVGFGDDGADEFPYARMVADRYATDHTEIRLDADRYLDLLPALIEKRDAPLGVPNEVPLHEMSRVLKQDITVVLSGEGADEIFGGYGDYVRIPFDYAKARRLARLPAPLRRPLLGGMQRKYGERIHFRDEADHFLAGYKWFAPEESRALFTPPAWEAVDGAGSDTYRALFARTAGLSYYDRVLYVLEKVHLQNLLHRVDSMTMATAVEGRVPFVDHALVEFVAAMPIRYKLRWRSPLHHARALLSYSDKLRERDDVTKYILRRAFADLLPPAVVARRKVGFKVPLDRWFRGDLRRYAQDLLLSDAARRRGILDVAAVERWLARGEANGGEFAVKAWMLINLELWFRLYFPEGGTSAYPAPRVVAGSPA